MSVSIFKSKPNLDDLATAWRQAKIAEEIASKQRMEIEDQIIALTGEKDEGSETHTTDHYKIIVTSRVSRSMDWDTYWNQVSAHIPENLQPVNLVPKLDEKGVKWLQSNRPDLYQILSQALTAKKAKTGVSIKEVK